MAGTQEQIIRALEQMVSTVRDQATIASTNTNIASTNTVLASTGTVTASTGTVIASATRGGRKSAKTTASALTKSVGSLSAHIVVTIFKPRPGRAQTVAIASATGAMASGIAGLGARLHADVSCHFDVASAPVANASSPILPAGIIEEIGVRNGEKVAVMVKAGGATGTMHITTLGLPE